MTSGTAGRTRSAALAAGLCATLWAAMAGFPARAATVPVAGAGAVRPAARVLGPAPSRRVMHMTVTLRPRDRAALLRYARAVGTLGSPLYHAYLDPAQFAARFGAPAARIATVSRWLRARGLAPGRVSRGGLSIAVTATVGRLQRALGIALNRVALPSGRRAMAARAAPVVPLRSPRRSSPWSAWTACPGTPCSAGRPAFPRCRASARHSPRGTWPPVARSRATARAARRPRSALTPPIRSPRRTASQGPMARAISARGPPWPCMSWNRSAPRIWPPMRPATGCTATSPTCRSTAARDRGRAAASPRWTSRT